MLPVDVLRGLRAAGHAPAALLGEWGRWRAVIAPAVEIPDAEAGPFFDEIRRRITGGEAWAWRLLFTLLAMFAGTGVLAYVLMWILVPSDPPTSVQAPGRPLAG